MPWYAPSCLVVNRKVVQTTPIGNAKILVSEWGIARQAHSHPTLLPPLHHQSSLLLGIFWISVSSKLSIQRLTNLHDLSLDWHVQRSYTNDCARPEAVCMSDGCMHGQPRIKCTMPWIGVNRNAVVFRCVPTLCISTLFNSICKGLPQLALAVVLSSAFLKSRDVAGSCITFCKSDFRHWCISSRVHPVCLVCF